MMLLLCQNSGNQLSEWWGGRDIEIWCSHYHATCSLV